MDHQENKDPVWKLLSRAGRVEPSPFFARNVVREVRLLHSKQSTVWNRLSGWFSARALFAGSVACAGLALSLILLSQSPRGLEKESGLTLSPSHEIGSDVFDPASEMASIEYLGQLMAVADPGQLNDAALADLFY